MTPAPPPKANRKVNWDYDRETCKLRNEIERLFRRFKGCRRIFTRFDKLDATFLGFVSLAADVEMMHDLAWTGSSNCISRWSNLGAYGFRSMHDKRGALVSDPCRRFRLGRGAGRLKCRPSAASGLSISHC